MDTPKNNREIIITSLLNSSEPAIRYKTLVHLSGRQADAAQLSAMQEAIRDSARVQTLLAERDARGEIPRHPYSKWRGAHWVLSCLAEVGYPPGDHTLMPLLEQVYQWLLSAHHLRSVKTIAGRTRRCASQEGNAVYYALALGLEDERTEILVKRLLQWQWPDGGWNCDKNPAAVNSSFHESLIPMRALALYGRRLSDSQALQAAERAAEIFLKRELFRQQKDGVVIHPDFVLLHFPYYWRYNFLFGLLVMSEAGFLSDPRCAPAVELLQAKQLPEGGFPAEKRYYRVSTSAQSGASAVDWGPTSPQKMNEFVSIDALRALEAAGRDGRTRRQGARALRNAWG